MNTTLTIYLVRHAQSQNNALPESQRVSDPPITELGQSQAEKLSNRLQVIPQGEGPEVILCSPFLRTMQTIQPAARKLSKTPVIWSQLFEAGGCYEGYEPGQLTAKSGMTHSEISEIFPEFDIPDDIDEQGWYRGGGFEEWHQASARAKEQAARLFDEHFGKHQSVLCMIHGDLIKLLLSHYCPGNTVYSQTDVANTSFTTLLFSQEHTHPTVLSHNDTSHLDTDEVSH